MNILLVNPPIRESVPAYFQPFGLATIAAVLRDAGHIVYFLDLNIHRVSLDDVAPRLPTVDFDLIGTGGLVTTYGYLCHLVPLLREMYPKARIVIGGGGITSALHSHMENLRPDYAVIGEGEWTMLELANGAPASEILGLAYWCGDGWVANDPRPLEPDLDKFPMQAFDMLYMGEYAEHTRHNRHVKREIGILATRGCPMDCAFCYHVFGRGVRYRSPRRIVDEMEFLIQKYGIESFLFADECLTARKTMVLGLCDEILARNIKTQWSCFSRVDTLDEPTIKRMAEAGCFQVGFGIESGSQRILNLMHKRTSPERAKAAIETARKYVHVGCTLIFGFPGENAESIEETYRFCCESLVLGRRFFHLSPYPGTAVFEEHKPKILAKFGTMHNFLVALGDATEFVVNLTEWNNHDYFAAKSNLEQRLDLLFQIQKGRIREHELLGELKELEGR